MGGGRRYPYPKWVWSPSGGWWPSPTKWKRDTGLFLGVSAVVCYFLYNYAEANTVVYHRKLVVKDHSEYGHKSKDEHH